MTTAEKLHAPAESQGTVTIGGASFGPGPRLPLAAAIEDPGGSSLDECRCPVRLVAWAKQAALLGTHELAWLRGGGAEMVISKDWCA